MRKAECRKRQAIAQQPPRMGLQPSCLHLDEFFAAVGQRQHKVDKRLAVLHVLLLPAVGQQHAQGLGRRRPALGSGVLDALHLVVEARSGHKGAPCNVMHCC
jgi:hypothetical protein